MSEIGIFQQSARMNRFPSIVKNKGWKGVKPSSLIAKMF